jgi:phenylacetate-CoA ligase
MYDWKMALYWRLPVFLQEYALSGYARYLERLYYGPGYDEWRQECVRWQQWSWAQMEAWQNQHLQALIALAAQRVPYYRVQWRGLAWRDVCSVADLPLLPRLDKHAIRQQEELFLVEGHDPKSLWMEKTSGTTGTSLRIFWPKAMLPKWWALYEVMCRNPIGAAQELPRAMLGGRPIVRGDTRHPPYWRFNRYWCQLYLSSYHVSRATAASYIGALQRYGSCWMTGYGSAVAALADSAIEAGLAPLSMRAVLVSGDTLLSGMRASIEQFFGCRCFDHYGQCEGVATAMECLYGRLHVLPMLGIIEIVRDDGSLCAPGEMGEIVATGLLNDAMPLIRYRVGDYAAWAEEQHCQCGSPTPILARIEGRVDDYLVTADGRKIGRLSTAVKRSPSIRSAQLVQDCPGHAYLLVCPGEHYQFTHAMAVRDDILERIGKFALDIIEVPEIPRTPQGKTALVVRLADRPHMRPAYASLLQ